MKQAQIAILLVATTLFSLQAWAQNTPVGLWKNIDDKTGEAKAEIRIKDNGAGVLTGVIERSLVKEGSSPPNCDLCTDDRKGKPKVGMEIIRGAKKAADKDVWEHGKILDPENGKNYTLGMTPIEDGKKLQVRGYIGPFYRTQVWQRVQ
jgi:uncharacterized protein (DUF2147 family)